MVVKNNTGIKEIKGKPCRFELFVLSTDEKPTEIDGVLVGDQSLAFETDTETWYYFADGQWSVMGETPSTPSTNTTTEM